MVCPRCQEVARGSYYCDAHRAWKGAYHYFLSHFTLDELGGQLRDLRVLHTAMVGDKKLKNRYMFRSMRLALAVGAQ